MKKILLIQGANMNYLGKREPEIYGHTTAAELDEQLLQFAKKEQFHLDLFYSNIEGEVINKVYECVDNQFDGLVMNPAGFTYAGYALRDCIKGVNLPYIEIHISNIAKRHIHSVLAEVAHGVIYGFGLPGYQIALRAMLDNFRQIT